MNLKYSRLIGSLILSSIPTCLIYPQNVPELSYPVECGQNLFLQRLLTEDHTLSYDAILELLEQIENDELVCTPEEENQISQFLAYLARQGMMPSDSEIDKAILERDIQEMLTPSPFVGCSYFLGSQEFAFAPAIDYGSMHPLLCKGWLSKKWKHVKHFVKHHKTAVIIGSVVVVAAVVVVAVVASTAAAASGVAAVAAGTAAGGESSSTGKSDLSTVKEMQPTVEEQASAIRTIADQSNLLTLQSDNPPNPEDTRIIGSTLAHEVLNNVPSLESEGWDKAVISGHGAIDNAFTTDQSIHYMNSTPSGDMENRWQVNVFQQQGEQALRQENFEQAVEHFGKAIEADPQNHDAYLQRAYAYMGLGEYDRSLSDYRNYALNEPQKSFSLSNTIDFGIGFAQNLPKGVAESGRQLAVFASDLIAHPIDTGSGVCQAFASMAQMAYTQQWAELSQCVAPEVCQLVNEWDLLTPREQGERAGYIFGKYGGDILIPGATAKVISKGINGAKDIVLAAKNLQTAEQTFALEALAQSASNSGVLLDVSTVYKELKTAERAHFLESGSGLENSAKFSEVVQLEKRISEWLGEEAKLIRNEAGDPVFISKDGLRCVRFDFNYPYPHNQPHAHVEVKVDGKWIKSGQIYPIDVSHN